MALQALLRAIYPPQCLTCDTLVAEDFALCPACWRDTPFIAGLVCDLCGAPLPGEDPGHPVHCDDCLAHARPWSRGRAALLYHDRGRRIVLSLKHGDRTDLAGPLAAWMLRAARPILVPEMVVAPVPMHRWRLLTRRQNHAALLSAALARAAGLAHVPDLFLRTRATPTQEGRSRDARFANLDGAIRLHPRRASRIAGRPVLIVDDVLTSGATLAAAADAARGAQAASVAVAVLARVAKDA